MIDYTECVRSGDRRDDRTVRSVRSLHVPAYSGWQCTVTVAPHFGANPPPSYFLSDSESWNENWGT
eukprot:736124-Hanusia_phi.AAC.1